MFTETRTDWPTKVTADNALGQFGYGGGCRAPFSVASQRIVLDDQGKFYWHKVDSKEELV